MLYWYKLETHFGPGHQGVEIRYFFTEHKLNKESKHEYEHEEAESISRQYDCSAITNIEYIKKPPHEVIVQKRDNAKLAIADALYIIDALKDE